jgi:hypothetical protein
MDIEGDGRYLMLQMDALFSSSTNHLYANPPVTNQSLIHAQQIHKTDLSAISVAIINKALRHEEY